MREKNNKREIIIIREEKKKKLPEAEVPPVTPYSPL